MSNDKHQPSNPKPSGSSADDIASLLDEDTLRFGDEAPLTPQEPGVASEAEPVALSEEHRTLKASFDDQLRTQQATIASLEESLSRAKEAVIRAQAETANAHRRAEKTIADAHKYAIEKFAKQLLEVVDSLERALEVDLSARNESSVKSLQEGVRMTLDLLLATLERFAVTVIDPVGKVFDPQLHEAIVMQPAEGTASGTVLNVVQKGYALHGRLIRPARVVVAK